MKTPRKSPISPNLARRAAYLEPLEYRVLLSAIASGQTIAGTIAAANPQDTYTFSIDAGQTFDITLGDASAASDLRPYLQVFNPSNARVINAASAASNTSVNGIYTVPAAGAGMYTVIVQDQSGAHVGAYDLELAIAPATQAPDADGDGGTISSGQTKAGTVSRTGDLDIFTFTAAAGNTFDISLGDASAASDLRPYLQVYNPSGTRVVNSFTAANNTSVDGTYTVPAAGAGTYTVIVQDETGGHTGAYDLELALAPATQAPDADGDGGAIVSGQTKGGTVSRMGDLDIFTFSAAAGNTIDITLGDASSASDVRPYLQLYDPTGNRVVNAFTAANNTSVNGIYQVPAAGAGVYTAIVQDETGTHMGAYDVELAVAPATQASDSDGDGGVITSGQTKAGSVNRTGDLDIFTFTAAAGNTFDVSFGDASNASDLRPYLQIFDPTGTRVINSFTAANNTSVDGIYQVPAAGAGTYTIVVQDETGGHVGLYDLELALAPSAQAADADGDGGTISSGQTKAGAISRTGDLDVFTFTAAVGNTFDISFGDASNASDLRPYLQVFDPTGARVVNAFTAVNNTSVDGIVAVPAAKGGTYTVVVQDETGTHTGAYDLELAIAAATQSADSDGDGGVITANTIKTGTINRTGDLDVYTFNSIVGATFDVLFGDASNASDVRPYLQVFDPSGTRITNAFTAANNTSVSGIHQVLVGNGGTYTIVVQDETGSHLGAYAVEFNEIHGDMNGDNQVDLQDQSIVTNHWQTKQSTRVNGDINGDGFVDLQDLTTVTNNWQAHLVTTFVLPPAPSVSGASTSPAIASPLSAIAPAPADGQSAPLSLHTASLSGLARRPLRTAERPYLPLLFGPRRLPVEPAVALIPDESLLARPALP